MESYVSCYDMLWQLVTVVVWLCGALWDFVSWYAGVWVFVNGYGTLWLTMVENEKGKCCIFVQ